VRKRRLLAPEPPARVQGAQAGSALLESIFALLLLLVLVLGAIQVAFVLYARNVVAAAAHEGARAAVELGRNADDARTVASEVVRSSAGGLVEQMEVAVSVQTVGDLSVVRVRVTGRLKSFGVVPVRIPVGSVATSVRREAPV
jgi:Flp pilus assembly protein TadG